MIKIGIIGCGKISDSHANHINRISGCEIVGVCDREELMAKQMCDRFKARYYFDDVHKLLEVTRPDIIHITTPPQSHFELGKLCLESGCHVYMEKPFTLNVIEAEKLIKLAMDKNLKITVGHNKQFSHAAIKMRQLINDGYLGGTPIHMESIFCYDFGDKGFARSLMEDESHWVRKLPGKLLHNIIAHGISKIAEFIKDTSPKVIADGFTSHFLQSIDQSDIIDELRVIIRNHSESTAYFTFSSQIRPTIHQFRIYGPKNSLIIDEDHETLVMINGLSYKSYLDQFIPPLNIAKQYLINTAVNIKKFIKNDFHSDSGRKYLIENFYRSVIDDTPLPISYKEIIITAKIMDDIFAQINSSPTMING